MCVIDLYIYSSYNRKCLVLGTRTSQNNSNLNTNNNFNRNESNQIQSNDPFSNDNFEGVKVKNTFHYHWKFANLNDIKTYRKHKPSFSNGDSTSTTYTKPLFEDTYKNELFSELFRLADKALNENKTSSNLNIELKAFNKSLATVIRDYILISSLNNIGGVPYSTINNTKLNNFVRGVILTSNEDFNLFKYVFNFAKKLKIPRTYHYSHPKLNNGEKNKLRKLFSVNLFKFLKNGSGSPEEKTEKLCYINRLYSATCSCNQCSSVVRTLSRNHRDYTSNSNLKKLVENHLFKLVVFINHNKRIHNLELSILKVTLSGFLLKRENYKAVSESVPQENSQKLVDNDKLAKILADSVYVIFHNFQLTPFHSNLTEQNAISLSAMALDLISEYSKLWSELELPVFSFFLATKETQYLSTESSNVEQPKINPDQDFQDGESTSLLNILIDDGGFKFLGQVPNNALNEFNKIVYFSELLQGLNSIQIKEKTFHSKNNNLDSLLSHLIGLTKGYSLDELPVLTRMTKCLLYRDTKSGDRNEKLEFEDFDEFVNYFEQALYVRAPLNLEGTVISPEISTQHRTHSGVPPLSIQNGIIKPKTGFSSIILSQQFLKQLSKASFLNYSVSGNSEDEFLTGEDFDFDGGPNPSSDQEGKLGLIFCDPNNLTNSAIPFSLAQELGALFVPINILNFIRANVGVAEKLLHSVLSSIFTHLSSSASGGYFSPPKGSASVLSKSRRPTCVILLENLGALNSGVGFERRILHTLLKLLDDFFLNIYFKSDHSFVFFISNSGYTDNLEENYHTENNTRLMKLLNNDKFVKVDVPVLKLDKKYCKRVFELFLNHRCNFELDKLMDYIVEKDYLEKMTVFGIIKAVKETVYSKINTLSMKYYDDEDGDDKNWEEELMIDLETIKSVLDSQINKHF